MLQKLALLACFAAIVTACSTTNSDSYEAGLEQGQSLQRSTLANGGTKLSKAEAHDACGMYADQADLLPSLRWSGGVIRHSELDMADYRAGCAEGIRSTK